MIEPLAVRVELKSYSSWFRGKDLRSTVKKCVEMRRKPD